MSRFLCAVLLVLALPIMARANTPFLAGPTFPGLVKSPDITTRDCPPTQSVPCPD